MRNAVIVLCAVVIMAWGMLSAVFEIGQQVDKRIENWERVTKEAKTFSNSIRALSPTAKKFDETFPERKKAKDINSLYRLIGFESLGLSGNPLATRILRISDAQVGSKIVGAIEVCLVSAGGGYEVRAKDMGALVKGVNTLLEKPWVDASGMSITVVPGQRKISAILADFCITLNDKDYIQDLRKEDKS